MAPVAVAKIAPDVLDKYSNNFAMPDNDKLIVGNNSKDDAAVYNLGNGTALISTTDFYAYRRRSVPVW